MLDRGELYSLMYPKKNCRDPNKGIAYLCLKNIVISKSEKEVKVSSKFN